MKKYFLFFIAFLICSGAWAGAADTTISRETKKMMRHTKPVKPPVCYLGLSTGISNAPGIFGLDFNICIGKYITLDAGAGPSTWGNKLYLGAKYYLKQPNRGWAVGGGVTYNSGEENVKLNLSTITGTREKVALTLKPQDDAFLAIYHYWTLGRKYNRFFIDLGKSILLHQPKYHEIYGDPLTEQANDAVKRLAPGGFLGGFMFGTGFSFGLYRK